MKVLHTTGQRDLNFVEWLKPEINDDQIEVRTVLTGICRSDIAAYMGWENAMPLGMQGHEGIGVVNKVGKNITEVKEGDFVATISDPTYAPFYNAHVSQFVKIPEISPKYILQPTACAMNIIDKASRAAEAMHEHSPEKILLIGTGFMSVIIGQFLSCLHSIDILGNSHKDIWNKLGHNLVTLDDLLKEKKQYDLVIDLSSNDKYFYHLKDLARLEGVICYASTPFTPVTTNFFDNNWNCHTFVMPSPRNKDFKDMMKWTVELIEAKSIDPTNLWTKGYSIHDEYKQAFEDGVNRSSNYIRGYFKVSDL